MLKELKDSNYLESVKDFHIQFDQPIEPKPILPSEKRMSLRVKLLKEELQELEDAIENKDLVEVADALCDIQYILSGTILEFGFGEKFKELFDEVQRSNMSKACLNLNQVEQTVEKYSKEGIEVYSVTNSTTGLINIYRTEDNKVLKNIDYSPVDLKSIIFS